MTDKELKEIVTSYSHMPGALVPGLARELLCLRRAVRQAVRQIAFDDPAMLANATKVLERALNPKRRKK